MKRILRHAIGAVGALLLCASAHAQSQLYTELFWERAAYGLIPGITPITLMGYNSTQTLTFDAIWPESAAYVPSAVALSSPYCASTDNTADVLTTGTGAWTLFVSGLDTSFARWNQTLNLNGQTSVNLSTANILLIDTMEVMSAGSGGMNAGVLRCGTGTNTAGVPAVVHSIMPVGSVSATISLGPPAVGALNKSQSFIYGVAAGNKLMCRNFATSSLFTSAAAATYYVVDGYTNLGIGKRMWQSFFETGGGNPSVDPSITVFPEKTLLVGRSLGATSTGPVQLKAECVLISAGADERIFK